MLKIRVVILMEWLYLFLKIVAIYFILIICLRILGKREVGELSIFDLVVLLIIADIASLGIDNNQFVLESYFCVGLLVIFQRLLSMLLLKKSFFRNFFDGSPVTIVVNGKLLIKNMKKERYSMDDLISQMRLEHIMDIDEIKLAILETNGTLSIFRKSKFEQVKLPVIISGHIVKESLDLFDLKEEEFKNCLKKENLNLKKIIYASFCQNTLFYFERNNNKEIELTSQEKVLSMRDTINLTQNN